MPEINPASTLTLDVQSSELWENVFLSFKSPVHAKLLQSCPTLCDPMDCSPPGSSVHGILQARILEKGCHFLLQGIFLTLGIELTSLMSPALAGGFFTTSTTWEAL